MYLNYQNSWERVSSPDLGGSVLRTIYITLKKQTFGKSRNSEKKIFERLF